MLKVVNRKFIWFVIIFSVSLTYSNVGDWHSFTYLNKITCLELYKGDLFVGTTGGIRQIHLDSYNRSTQTFSELIYNNPYKDIHDVEIMGMIVTAAGELWASSLLGFLYKYDNNYGWSSVDRGFASLGWRFNPNAMTSANIFLLLGSNKGLSFFNTKSGYVELNIDRFGTDAELSVNSILVQDSMLYAGTSKGVYLATIYWDNPKSPPQSFIDAHGSIYNPLIWQKLSYLSKPDLDSAASYGFIAREGDSIKAYHGGKIISGPISVRAIPGHPLEINGYADSALVNMFDAAVSGNTVYLADSTGLWLWESGSYFNIVNNRSLPKGLLANVHSSSYGDYIWMLNMQTYTATFHKLLDNKWTLMSNSASLQDFEPIEHKMDNFKVVSEDEIYLGNWGFGLFHYNKGTPIIHNDQLCLDPVPDLGAYLVIHSSALYGNKGLFMTNYLIEPNNYHLAYMDFSTSTTTCFKSAPVTLSSPAARAYQMKVFQDSLLFVNTSQRLEIYKISDPSSPLGLSLFKQITSPDNFNIEIRTSVLDTYGRLWFSTYSHIYHTDNFLQASSSGDSIIRVDEIDMERCTQLELDAQGNIWAGCQNGLFNIITGRDKALLKFRHYENKDGLLTNSIQNFSINPDNGHIWIATEKGLNIFETPGRTAPTELPSVKVYPNPFKPSHEYTLIDNIPDKSQVYILNQAGYAVYKSSARDFNGWQLRWYGTNNAGKKVSPGIYTYIVKSPNNTARGHIIVAR